MHRIAAHEGRGEVIVASIALLEQSSEFLRRLSPADHQRPCPLLAGSTIGQHVRHLLDHFGAVLGPCVPGVIDYDHRERDTPIENDPAAARQLIEELIQSLSEVQAPAASIRVRVMLSPDGRESLLGSTIERELAFATHHAIHHHAMIAAIARALGIEVPAGFGVAPSTQHHRQLAEHR